MEIGCWYRDRKSSATGFHCPVEQDPICLGRNTGRIADWVISHLPGLMGSQVKIAPEILVDVRGGIPENVVMIVREN
jgi:hypothetical protein